MMYEPASTAELLPEHPARLKRVGRTVLIVVRALQVRLRFILVLAAALIAAGQWETLRTYWDHITRGHASSTGSIRVVSSDTEYFCPMDPVVVSVQPGKCDICDIALVRRKVGDMAPLPSGVLARMQRSPHRVQVAGVETAAAEYRATMGEAALIGMVRGDGLVQCRVPDHDRLFVVAGQAAEVAPADGQREPSVRGEVSKLDVDPGESGTSAVIRLEGSGRALSPGTRVLATVRRAIAEIEPFRSLPSDAPPLVKGDLLAVYVCPQHPEVLETERGRCPVDRNHKLRRRALLDNQRVGWWCPTHPNVAASRAGALCQACDGGKLVPRIITYRPAGQVLTVPESAVIGTGMRTGVFVERMPGIFESVEVHVGPRCGDAFPVASGLEPGQRIATNGAFLLDAETCWDPAASALLKPSGIERERDEPAASARDSAELAAIRRRTSP